MPFGVIEEEDEEDEEEEEKTIKVEKKIQKRKHPKEIKPTLDTLRGLNYFIELKGDKTMKKAQLKRKIKRDLLDPNTFGLFLERISKYLQSL